MRMEMQSEGCGFGKFQDGQVVDFIAPRGRVYTQLQQFTKRSSSMYRIGPIGPIQ